LPRRGGKPARTARIASAYRRNIQPDTTKRYAHDATCKTQRAQEHTVAVPAAMPCAMSSSPMLTRVVVTPPDIRAQRGACSRGAGAHRRAAADLQQCHQRSANGTMRAPCKHAVKDRNRTKRRQRCRAFAQHPRRAKIAQRRVNPTKRSNKRGRVRVAPPRAAFCSMSTA